MEISNIASKVWNGHIKSSIIGFSYFVGKGPLTDFWLKPDGSLQICNLNGVTLTIPVGQYLVRIGTTYFISKVRHTKFK